MIENKDEIVKRLETEDIETVIATIDAVSKDFLFIWAELLKALKKHKDIQPYIAERIDKLIFGFEKGLDNGYKEKGDDWFWLGMLLLNFNKHDHVLDDIYEHVAKTEDSNELKGLNVLINNGVLKSADIIIRKLRTITFDKKNADKISFYLDKLKALKVVVPEDIAKKSELYNNTIARFEWEKLGY